MQVIILAGGRGKRLNPMTNYIPKPLLPLGLKTVVEYQIDNALRYGATEIILTLHYKAQLVIAYLKPKGYEVRFIVEEEPLGTAGSIKNIENFLEPTFMVLSGDNYSEQNLSELWKYHDMKGAELTIGLVKAKDPTSYAVVKLDGNGRVVKFKEKPRKNEVFSDEVSCGMYIMNKNVLGYIPKKSPFDISYNLIPNLLTERRRVYGRLLEGFWEDVGSFKNYLRAAFHYVGSLADLQNSLED